MLIDRQIKPFVISSEESVINALQKMCQSGSRAMLLTSEAGVLEGVFTDRRPAPLAGAGKGRGPHASRPRGGEPPVRLGPRDAAPPKRSPRSSPSR